MTDLLDAYGRPMMAQETDKDRVIHTPVFYYRRTTAGETVTHDNALLQAAVWACVRVISETLSMLPWRVHKRQKKGGSEVQPGHIVDERLHVRPCPEVDPTAWREAMIISALTWGNGYSEIDRNRAGQPTALYPISPDRVTMDRDEDGVLVYLVHNSMGEPTPLYQEAVFHLKGPSLNGLAGSDAIMHAAQAIGLAMAAEKGSGAHFANGGTPAGFLKHEGVIDDDEAEKLLKNWANYHAGSANRGRMGLLKDGLDYLPVGATNVESQLDETRLFQVLEICRIFRVPPHKVAELSRATYDNITEQEVAFFRDTLMPWVVRLENEADYKLLRPAERKRLFTKVNANAILRGSPKERAEFYKVLAGLGAFTVNDILAKEDMNPGGPECDERIVGLNMTTLKALVKNAENPPKPVENPLNPPQNEPKPPNRAARAKAAQYPVIRHTAARIIKREVHRVLDASRRSQDNADFSARLDGLYDEHRHYTREQLQPACKAFWTAAAMSEPNGAVDDVLAHCVSKYVRDSRETLAVAYDEGRIDDVCDEWVADRPDAVAETVTNNLMLALGVAGELEGGA